MQTRAVCPSMGNASTEVARANVWIRPCRAAIASCFVVAAFALGCRKSEPTEVTIRGEPPCCTKHGPEANVPSTPPAGFEPVEVAGVAGTGHGQAVVLANREWALPIFVGLMIWFIDPKLMEPMFTKPIGIAILVVMVIMEALGYFFVRKVTNIEV